MVAKDFAVDEKKLHLTVSGRKYDPGKKASKRKRTSEKMAADPKPSTSQDMSVSEQQPQEESTSEQQPQSVSTTEEKPQNVPEPDTLSSQSSSDDTLTLPDYSSALKIFSAKDPSSIPKKPRYSSKPS